MPSATFVLEHLMAAQTRLDEAHRATPAAPTSASTSTALATQATSKVDSYQKKLLLALKKIVQ
ncbi:GL18227 [Drosophila persimilis]|uniref:GL18227 n=1 Tax=Drosophila persimilis TaxID=7234 RepID=B4H4I1_DROPE|nr:GL18227 [Drosophila persimilis]